MDILERLTRIEQHITDTEFKFSAKRNRATINSSDNFRLDALEKIVGINQNGEVVKND